MEVSELLKQTSLFSGLSEADLSALGQSTRLEVYEAGHVIVREGRVGAAFYIILTGKVEVNKGTVDAKPVVIGKLKAGEFFGEIGAMKHVTRSATVIAVEKTTCLVIRRLDLDSYIERYPTTALLVESALLTRFPKHP